jgi:hypothetical protein
MFPYGFQLFDRKVKWKAWKVMFCNWKTCDRMVIFCVNHKFNIVLKVYFESWDSKCSFFFFNYFYVCYLKQNSPLKTMRRNLDASTMSSWNTILILILHYSKLHLIPLHILNYSLCIMFFIFRFSLILTICFSYFDYYQECSSYSFLKVFPHILRITLGNMRKKNRYIFFSI